VELTYVYLMVIFYMLGLVEDFCWAMWTKKINEISYQALPWSLLIAVIRLVFIMGLIEYRDWGLGIVYVLGLVTGTGLMVKVHKNKNLKNTPSKNKVSGVQWLDCLRKK